MGLALTIIHTSEKPRLLQGLEIHRRTLQQQPSMPVVNRQQTHSTRTSKGIDPLC